MATSNRNVPRDIGGRKECECKPGNQQLAIVYPFLHYVCLECGGLKV